VWLVRVRATPQVDVETQLLQHALAENVIYVGAVGKGYSIAIIVGSEV
jgi:hypothetical protein